MATFKAASVLQPSIACYEAGEIVAAVGEYEVPATLAQNDLVWLCHLPAGNAPVDFMLQADDLDNGGTAITITVGVLNAAGDGLVASTDFITASTVGQAGGVVRAANVFGLQLAASDTDRIIAAKIVTAATTPQAGTIKGVLFYTPK